jgi:hypothetical protein
MDRINIYGQQESPDGRRPLIGWFDRAAVKGVFGEDTTWDGRNRISVATGSRYDHERLYCTAQDRWVLQRWSQWQGRQETFSFITPEQARDWLLANNHDQDAEAMFGEVEQERGPGRPQVGTPINLRLPDGMLAAVDSYADQRTTSRAAAVRDLLQLSLGIFGTADATNGHRPAADDLGEWVVGVAEATSSLTVRTVPSLLGVLRYAMGAELSAMAFTEAEAMAMANVHSSTIVFLALGNIAYEEMAEAFGEARPGAGGPSCHESHFSVDEQLLLEKLRAASPLADLALRLALARWWGLPAERRDVDGYRSVGINIVDELAVAR